MRLLSVALHEKRRPQPSPVGVVFRGNHEWAGWCVGRRHKGDGEKRRSRKSGLENEAPFTKNQPIYLPSNASKPTWNEVNLKHFAATAGPSCITGGVGVKDACQLALGVPLCPDECEVRAARAVTAPQRDRHTTPHCLTLIPARRVPARGVVGPIRIYVGGTTKRTMCVVCGPGSTASCQPRPLRVAT